MRKHKTAFAIFLALALIAGMALLPRWIAGISDRVTNGKPGTAAMQSVALSLYSDQKDEPGYMLRKLALEQWMTTVPIKPEQAKMTREAVLTGAVDGMTPYIEAGMFKWFDYQFTDAEPYLCIDPENKSSNMIVWGVTFAVDDKPYHHLFLHVDDETGKILYISYETDGPDKYNYYYKENQRLLMEGFTDSFYRPLGLSGDQLGDYKELVSQEVEERKLTDDVTCWRYTFDDQQYGVIYVEFSITPAGFSVTYPMGS